MANQTSLDIIVEVIFGIDIVLRFFHEYKDQESFEIVSDVKRIAKKYIQYDSLTLAMYATLISLYLQLGFGFGLI